MPRSAKARRRFTSDRALADFDARLATGSCIGEKPHAGGFSARIDQESQVRLLNFAKVSSGWLMASRCDHWDPLKGSNIVISEGDGRGRTHEFQVDCPTPIHATEVRLPTGASNRFDVQIELTTEAGPSFRAGQAGISSFAC